MIQTVSLFGGVAADDKAWKRLGIQTKKIDYVEIQPNRVKAYNALNPFEFSPQDVRGWNLKPDVLVHGSPCQDNSRANRKRKGNTKGSRSELLKETVRIIKEMGEWRPRVVIWENVKGVLDRDVIPLFNSYLQDMTKLGYTNSFEVLDARDFGIPQKRERVFCISLLGDEVFDFDKLERVPMKPISEFLQYGYNDEVPEQYLIQIPSMLNRIDEVNPAQPGETYTRRLAEIKDFCYTITERQDRCPNAGYIKCAQGYRYLTELEVFRLSGFDYDDYHKLLQVFPSKPGKRNSVMYALGGNTIVVDVLMAIFKLLQTGNYAKGLFDEKESQLQFVI